MKIYDINEKLSALQDTLESMEDISSEEEIGIIRDMLEDIEGERDEKLMSVARWRKQIQTEAKEVIGSEIKRLQSRKRSTERRAESIGKFLIWGLSKVPGQKIKSPLGSLAVAPSVPSTTIQDPKLVPSEYWQVDGLLKSGDVIDVLSGVRLDISNNNIVVSSINKKAILDCYKATGEQVPGCLVEQGNHVRFR